MHATYSQYKIISNAEGLFVPLVDVKVHLKLPATINTELDIYLTSLIKACTAFGEKYTRRIFIATSFRTYRDFFVPVIELRKSPYLSLTSFEYLKNETWTTVSSTLYYITEETDYSRIIFNSDATYPADTDDRRQAVKIEFIAGYSLLESTIYDYTRDELQLAVKNHIALVYENRGDCDSSSLQTNLPNSAKMIYGQYKLYDMIGEIDYFYN